MKDDWRVRVAQWRMANVGKKLTNLHFPDLLSKAFDSISTETVQSGFVATGLCPFNPDRIDFSKLIIPHNKFDDTLPTTSKKTSTTSASNTSTSTITSTSSQTSSVCSMEAHLSAFENHISPIKLDQFRRGSADGNISSEDLNLYKVWKRLRAEMNDFNVSFQNHSTPVRPTTSNEGNSQLQSTPEEQIRVSKNCPPPDIPSPFKEALRWPILEEKKKGKKKDFPLAITFEAWRNHHKKLEQEKMMKEKEKERKKKLRMQKKKKAEEKKNKNSRSVGE